jgi:hypothetical protein
MKRRVWLLIAIAALVIVWFLRSRPRAPAVTARAAEERPAAPALTPPLPPPVPGGVQLTGSLPPIIDGIELEKSEVCEGEENLVTVKAHLPDNPNQYLSCFIGSQSGCRVPVERFNRRRVEKMMVTVMGPRGETTTAEVPPYTIKDCRVARTVVIRARLLANTASEFELQADLQPIDRAAAKPFHPRSWSWDFGDGERVETNKPRALHGYGGRAQDAIDSSFVIAVRIASEEGEELIGRTTLTLRNPVFEELYTKGIVMLLYELEPRFAQRGADGVVRQRFRVWHLRPDPVKLESVGVELARRDGVRSSIEPRDVRALIGTDEIPPGEGVELELALDTAAFPDATSANYWIRGRSVEGLPAHAILSVVAPPRAPTDASPTVRDPMLIAKIKAAQSILHQRFVTDEDLWRLEREGYFDGLEPSPAPAGSATASREPVAHQIGPGGEVR